MVHPPAVRHRDLASLVIGAGAGLGAAVALYGWAVERRRLTVERRTLALPGWPEGLAGYRVVLLADLHVYDRDSAEMARRAAEAAVALRPDALAIAGDFVGHWHRGVPALLGDALRPLEALRGRGVAVPGNHDYHGGDPELLRPILDHLGVRLLRNESAEVAGVEWVGVDSAVARADDPVAALAEARGTPRVVVWHEPDMVDVLPAGVASLMLSGHAHGGQFVLPGGFTPKRTRLGKRYYSGYYDEPRVPVYVTRGVGTTLAPLRFGCPPEVTLLTLTP